MSKTPCLYVVATPIGNLGDLSPRAVEILRHVDYIAAEDTRHSRKLLDYFAIDTPLLSLHEYNESQRSKLLLKRLRENETVALISDAGTPLISDPGYTLVNAALEKEISVVPIPGPCALISALSVSGLDCRRFVFEGFLPEKKIARRKRLQDLIYETRTLIFYEAPHRILGLMEDILSLFGPERIVVLARELTKLFETIHKGCIEQLTDWLRNHTEQQCGEFVVLVKGSEHAHSHSTLEAQRILSLLLDALPIGKATSLAAKITHERKSKLYARALVLTGKTT